MMKVVLSPKVGDISLSLIHGLGCCAAFGKTLIVSKRRIGRDLKGATSQEMAPS
jgi:hypothetical protein